MLLNGAGTHRGGDNRSSHQHLYQDEDCATFSIIQMKSRISNSLLTLPKPMTTKVMKYFCIIAQTILFNRINNSSLVLARLQMHVPTKIWQLEILEHVCILI